MVTLRSVGGVIGIGLGDLAAVVMNKEAGWTRQVFPGGLLLAFTFAALVGLAFGMWPARRASVLDPIGALRYETGSTASAP